MVKREALEALEAFLSLSTKRVAGDTLSPPRHLLSKRCLTMRRRRHARREACSLDVTHTHTHNDQTNTDSKPGG